MKSGCVAAASRGGLPVRRPLPKKGSRKTALEPHAPHGERGDFLKVTATLSPEVYRLLSQEALRRRLGQEPNAGLSAIIREAVVAYLGARK